MKRSLLRDVFAKTEGWCWYCGCPLRPLEVWEVDHVVPVAQGGTNDLSNLVPACVDCNREKKNRTPEQWRRDLTKKVRRDIGRALDGVLTMRPRDGGQAKLEDALCIALRLTRDLAHQFAHERLPAFVSTETFSCGPCGREWPIEELAHQDSYGDVCQFCDDQTRVGVEVSHVDEDVA